MCATRPRSSAPSTAFARAPNGGLIVTASATAHVHRDLIVALAARHKLPAIYYDRFFVAGGGLISYGPDVCRSVPARSRLRRPHPQRREAGRPAGAGSRRNTSWSINLKTAKALGLEVPPTLLARADEVIE